MTKEERVDEPTRLDVAKEFPGKRLDQIVETLCKRAAKEYQTYVFFWSSYMPWASCEITICPGDTAEAVLADFSQRSNRGLEQMNPEAWYEAQQRFWLLRESILLSSGFMLQDLAAKLAQALPFSDNVEELFPQAFIDNDLDFMVYKLGKPLSSDGPWDILNKICKMIEEARAKLS